MIMFTCTKTFVHMNVKFHLTLTYSKTKTLLNLLSNMGAFNKHHMLTALIILKRTHCRQKKKKKKRLIKVAENILRKIMGQTHKYGQKSQCCIYFNIYSYKILCLPRVFQVICISGFSLTIWRHLWYICVNFGIKFRKLILCKYFSIH